MYAGPEMLSDDEVVLPLLIALVHLSVVVIFPDNWAENHSIADEAEKPTL